MYGNSTATAADSRIGNRLVGPNDEPRPVGNVDVQLRQVNDLIAGAHSRLGALIDRVQPVSRALPPSGVNGAGAANQAITSPLAETLRGHAIALESLLDKINSAIDAIDL